MFSLRNSGSTVVKVKVSGAQSCLTLCDPMDCSLPSSSVHGILQARILEWVAIPFSRESSWPRERTQVSWIVGIFFTVWATRAEKLCPEKFRQHHGQGHKVTRKWCEGSTQPVVKKIQGLWKLEGVQNHNWDVFNFLSNYYVKKGKAKIKGTNLFEISEKCCFEANLRSMRRGLEDLYKPSEVSQEEKYYLICLIGRI